MIIIINIARGSDSGDGGGGSSNSSGYSGGVGGGQSIFTLLTSVFL